MPGQQSLQDCLATTSCALQEIRAALLPGNIYAKYGNIQVVISIQMYEEYILKTILGT